MNEEKPVNVVIVGAVSPIHEQWMKELGIFLCLLAIEYEDIGDGENYILTKYNGRKIVLRVRANKVDGAFLTIGERL